MSVIFSNAGYICPVRDKNSLNRKICINSNPSQNSSTQYDNYIFSFYLKLKGSVACI